MIPVTTNYDRTLPHRGYVDAKEGRIFVKLHQPIHEKEVFDVFGTVGFMAISYEMRDDGIYYKEFEICEFSYVLAKPVEPPNTVEYVGLPPKKYLEIGLVFFIGCTLLAAVITWGAHCGN